MLAEDVGRDTGDPTTVTAPKYNQDSTLFFNTADNALTDKKDVQTALEELELDIEDLLAE